MKQPLNEVLSAAERKFPPAFPCVFEIHKVFLQTTRFDRQKIFSPIHPTHPFSVR